MLLVFTQERLANKKELIALFHAYPTSYDYVFFFVR